MGIDAKELNCDAALCVTNVSKEWGVIPRGFELRQSCIIFVSRILEV